MKLCLLFAGLAGAAATGDCVWSTSKMQFSMFKGKFMWSQDEPRCTSKEGSLSWEEFSRQSQKCSKHGYLEGGYREMNVTEGSESACSLESGCVWDNRTHFRKCESQAMVDQDKKYKESQLCEKVQKDQCADTTGCGFTFGDGTRGFAGSRCTTQDTASLYFSQAFQKSFFCSPRTAYTYKGNGVTSMKPQTKVGCENISFPLWVKNGCLSHSATFNACKQNVTDKQTGTACDKEKAMLVCDRAHPCYDISSGEGFTGRSMKDKCKMSSSKDCNLVCSESTEADKGQSSSMAAVDKARNGSQADAIVSMAHRPGAIAIATVMMSWLTLHFQSPC